MRITKLKLFTDELSNEFNFYTHVLGFELLRKANDSFSVRIGWSELTFIKSAQKYTYHYCFLIPCNQLEQALNWMERRVEIIDIDNGRRIQHFNDWNADSFYFYDASGNIVEFIVRYDLENESDQDFDITSVLGINEIGLPSVDIKSINDKLESYIGTKFYKGNFERFGTHGSLEGMFLFPNYEVKTTWFPTEVNMVPQPFEAVVENDGVEYQVDFVDGELRTNQSGN